MKLRIQSRDRSPSGHERGVVDWSVAVVGSSAVLEEGWGLSPSVGKLDSDMEGRERRGGLGFWVSNFGLFRGDRGGEESRVETH